MKKLHKKVGVIAISSALVVGAPLSILLVNNGGDLSGIVSEAASYVASRLRVDISNPKSPSLKIPFMVESQLKHASKEKIAKNDVNIVIGLSDIFNYKVEEINPESYDIAELISKRPHLKNVISNVERSFEDGNKFLRHLAEKGVQAGMHRYRVGKQDFIIAFQEDIDPGMMWWLYLDKWLYASDSYLKCFNKIKY